MRSEQKAELEKYCAYCEHSIPTYDKDRVLCNKKGIVSGGYCCRRFSYDPQKRTPAKKTLNTEE